MTRAFFTNIFLLVFTFSSFAQLSAVDYNSDVYEQFKVSKTYVVKTGNEKFDTELINAVKNLWTITPYEVIDSKEFETKVTDEAASFIISIEITPDRNKSGQIYHYLALINGGKKSISRYSYSDMLAYCPLNYFGNLGNTAKDYYRVRNMVESMIHAMVIVKENDIRGNSHKIVDGLQEVYNKRAGKIKERTLLFCPETLAGKISESDISEVYPFKYEICSREKLEQVIKEKSTEYYYYQPAITLNTSMFVFDPSNGEVVYFNYKMMGMVKKKDIQSLVEMIK